MTFKVPLLDTNNDNIKLLENICGEKKCVTALNNGDNRNF